VGSLHQPRHKRRGPPFLLAILCPSSRASSPMHSTHSFHNDRVPKVKLPKEEEAAAKRGRRGKKGREEEEAQKTCHRASSTPCSYLVASCFFT